MSGLTQPAAKVYAQALGEVGEDQDCLGEIYDDLHVILTVYDSEPQVRAFFASPHFGREGKWAVLREAFTGKVCQPVLGLLRLLVMKGRGALFDNVVAQFDRFKDEHENRVHAYLTVATPLEDAFRKALVKRLGDAAGKNVELHERVDPSMIGGAALRVGDKIIDRTLKNRLEHLKRHLLQAAAGIDTDAD